MKRQLTLMIGIFFILTILAGSVNAWMIPTHLYLNEQTAEKASSSVVGQVAVKYFDDYSCGDYMADASVFYYFQEGFTSIGKEYKATHSPTMCQRAVTLATRAGDDRKLAFAYGICAHQVQDSISHNSFVPRVIIKTKLYNGIIHVLAEESVDDVIRTPERLARAKSQLRNTCVDHREFFVEIAEGSSELRDIDVGALYDEFIKQVAGADKYEVGFKSFLAIPTSIHVVLMLFFVLFLLIMALLIRLKKKNIFNWIGIILLAIFVLLIIIAYALYFTGNIWQFFTTFSYPLTAIMPTGGWESDVQTATDGTVELWNQGASYTNKIADPAGLSALTGADAQGSGVRLIIFIVLFLVLIGFVYLNFRKKRKI